MRLPPCLIAPLLCLGLSAPALSAPALWEVSDGDSKIWLFGSFHLLPDDVEWRTPVFDAAFEDAQMVYFEADISAAAQSTIVARSYELGFNTDGRLLSEILNRKEMAALRASAKEAEVSMPMLLTMKPWMAANALSAGAMTGQDFNPSYGVDYLLQQELPAERKGYFETAEEQLNFIAGGSMEEQVAMLNMAVKEMGQASTLLDNMLEAWSEGTADTLVELFLGGGPGAYEESFVERVIYQRNRNWMAPIKTMLADNEAAMVVVGTGHLVGDGSVVDLLGKDGFTVNRIQ